MKRMPSFSPSRRAAGLAAAGALAVMLIGLLSSAMAASYLDPPWGYDSAAADCVVCHSLEKGGPFRVAPNLWGIVGDDIARDREWFSYSPALVKMGGEWTEEDLDRFLEDASAFAPGSTKSIRVKDPATRAEIIEFLKTLDD
jgi:cytochrome c